jgi:basic membrane protein A
MAVPAVVRYGYGFVQGANAAAAEMGNAADVSIKYWYAQSFAPSDEIKVKMDGWYSDGTQVSLLAAAACSTPCCSGDEVPPRVGRCVDSDQSHISERS